MALFTRVKEWIDLENLTDEDLNAEFDNIISNTIPASIEDYSASTTQMRTQTTPGSVGSESLATSLAGELERIRYMLAQITGKTYWYQAPDKSLAAANTEPAVYLPFNGGSADEAYADTLRRGAIVNAVSQSSEDFSSGDLSSTQAKFGKYSYGLGASNILAIPANRGPNSSGSLGLHFYEVSAGDYLGFNPQLGLELYLSGAGKLVAKLTTAAASSESAKTTQTITGTNTVSGTASWKHALLKWAANAINGASTDLLALKLDGTAEGSQLSSQSFSVNVGDGGIWFLGAKRNDPTWSHFYAASGLPTAHSSAWTASGTAGQGSVSGGVLSITESSTNQLAYTRTSGVDMANMTIEFKMKVDTLSIDAADYLSPLSVEVRDDSMDRSFKLTFMNDHVCLAEGVASGGLIKIPVDTRNWHVYRITSSGAGNPTVKLYIDGVFAASISCNTSDATASDVFRFGKHSSASASTYSSSQWEYFAYYSSGATAPITGDTAGYLDDIVLLPENLNDSSLESSLSSAKAFAVLGKDSDSLIGHRELMQVASEANDDNQTVTLNDAAPALITTHYFHSDGHTPIDIDLQFTIESPAIVTGQLWMVAVIDDELTSEIGEGHGALMNLWLNTPAEDSAAIVYRMQSRTVLKPGLRKLTLIGIAQNTENYTFRYYGLSARFSYDK